MRIVPKTLVMSEARSCAAFWMGAGSRGSISNVVRELIVICPRATGTKRKMLEIKIAFLRVIIMVKDVLRKRQCGQPLRFANS